jgi:hypothetical protein
MNTPEAPHISNNIVVEAMAGGAIFGATGLAEQFDIHALPNPTLQLAVGLGAGSAVLAHMLFRAGRQTHPLDA